MTMFTIEQLKSQYQADARAFVLKYWGTRRMVSRGILYNVLDYAGFIALVDNVIAGILTYRIDEGECEVLLLQSAVEGMGIGAALIDATKQVAQNTNCHRLCLITSNDNVHAIRWYQKRGFTIAAVHINAIEQSRKLKPEIPLTGFDDIPLRDEIEFEIILK